MTALWGLGVGPKARYFAFSIVALTSLFIALWVGISNGIYKNFETPTPVCISGLPIPRSTANLWLVLVLDRSQVPLGALDW